MPGKVTMIFKVDGTVTVQGVEGQVAEKALDWLLRDLGTVEVRGHKHGAKAEEHIQQRA